MATTSRSGSRATHAGQPEAAAMAPHTCPICGQAHEVRESRAQLAYGRQLTCSPHCESERRKRMRYQPFSPMGRDSMRAPGE